MLKKPIALLAMLILLLVSMVLSGCGVSNTGNTTLSKIKRMVRTGESIDFSEIAAMKHNICAWLYIPGTEINAPVFFENGAQPDINGLYIQTDYNSVDLTDPTIVIYGPLTYDGSLFGRLQEIYSEDESLQKFGLINVQTRNGPETYRAFAASMFRNEHLLHEYNGLKDPQDREAFLENLKNYHVISHQWNEAANAEEEDKWLILSCHATQNDDLRYLVVAKQVQSSNG